MGSGELTATMVTVHKELLQRLGARSRAVFIDTPAGFQLNVDHLSQRAQAYFHERVRHPLTIASLKSADAVDTVQLETSYALLRGADYMLIGPGSPTYALRQWRRTQVPELIFRRIQDGACLVLASAAALTAGRWTLPVYEIYKVGQPPYWEEGLDLLGRFGMDCVVLPHWNNAEGGNHDTRFCFMGAPRLALLESLLPADTTLVGLDEHTALMIDLTQPYAVIRGVGGVTLRRNGEERVFTKGDQLPLALLRGDVRLAAEGGTLPRPEPSPSTAAPPADEVWDPIHSLAETIQAHLADNRVEQATAAILELERHITDRYEALLERSAMGAAREVLRDMLVLIGTRLAQRPVDRKSCVAPLVEALLIVRERFRQHHQWSDADAIRDCLQQAGVSVSDTADGTTWNLAD